MSVWKAACGQLIGAFSACLNTPSLFHPPLSDLDLSLSPTGRIVKKVGETLEVTVEKNASGEAHVTWTKVRRMRQVQECTSLPFLISVFMIDAPIQKHTFKTKIRLDLINKH